MKKFTFFCLLCLFVCFMCSSVFAGGGKAYIPHYLAYSDGTVIVVPFFYMSNITGNDITVEITLYQQNNSSGNAAVLVDGDDNGSTGILRAVNVSSYDESPTSGASVKFCIAPYETAYFFIQLTSGTELGYGVIEWSQNSDVIVGLIGYEVCTTSISNNSFKAERTISINNGNPF